MDLARQSALLFIGTQLSQTAPNRIQKSISAISNGKVCHLTWPLIKPSKGPPNSMLPQACLAKGQPEGFENPFVLRLPKFPRSFNFRDLVLHFDAIVSPSWGGIVGEWQRTSSCKGLGGGQISVRQHIVDAIVRHIVRHSTSHARSASVSEKTRAQTAKRKSCRWVSPPTHVVTPEVPT